MIKMEKRRNDGGMAFEQANSASRAECGYLHINNEMRNS